MPRIWIFNHADDNPITYNYAVTNICRMPLGYLNYLKIVQDYDELK